MRDPAGFGVLMTTNSCTRWPSFVTRNVTWPALPTEGVGLIVYSASEAAMFAEGLVEGAGVVGVDWVAVTVEVEGDDAVDLSLLHIQRPRPR